MKPDKHIECVSDFCGNEYPFKPGAWADLWERADGSRYISLGGGWCYYAEKTPDTIDETSPHFKPFLKACDAGEDFGYAREHFSSNVK